MPRRLLVALAFVVPICAALVNCGGSSGAASGSQPALPPPEYTAFATPSEVAITGYTGDAMEPFISKDGQYLFFNNRNDRAVDTNLYYASRVDDKTFTFLGAVSGVNSPMLDAVASLDQFGNFYFVSNRSYAATLSTIYSGAWSAASGVANVALVAGVSRQQGGSVNFDAEISADGRTLWFDDGQYSSSGVLQTASIAMANRQGAAFTRQANSAALLAAVNTGGLNYAPSISVDGLELFFTRIDTTTSGAAPAIYRSTRPDTSTPFGPRRARDPERRIHRSALAFCRRASSLLSQAGERNIRHPCHRAACRLERADRLPVSVARAHRHGGYQRAVKVP